MHPLLARSLLTLIADRLDSAASAISWSWLGQARKAYVSGRSSSASDQPPAVMRKDVTSATPRAGSTPTLPPLGAWLM